MPKESIQVELRDERATIIGYLQSIVDGLTQGRVAVQHGEETLTLSPADEVTFAVEARRKEDRESLSLKIGWRVAPARRQNALTISSALPAEAPRIKPAARARPRGNSRSPRTRSGAERRKAADE